VSWFVGVVADVQEADIVREQHRLQDNMVCTAAPSEDIPPAATADNDVCPRLVL
jgi:hypothetical protein